MRLFFLLSLLAFNAIAYCPASLEIDLFSNQFADEREVNGYEQILDEMDYLRYDLGLEGKYTVKISAGAMNEQELGAESTRPLMISDIMVMDANQNVKFRDIKKRRVSDTQVDAKRILKFVRKHIGKKLPFCTGKS